MNYRTFIANLLIIPTILIAGQMALSPLQNEYAISRLAIAVFAAYIIVRSLEDCSHETIRVLKSKENLLPTWLNGSSLALIIAVTMGITFYGMRTLGWMPEGAAIVGITTGLLGFLRSTIRLMEKDIQNGYGLLANFK